MKPKGVTTQTKAFDEYILIVLFVLLLKREVILYFFFYKLYLDGETWRWKGSQYSYPLAHLNKLFSYSLYVLLL